MRNAKKRSATQKREAPNDSIYMRTHDCRTTTHGDSESRNLPIVIGVGEESEERDEEENEGGGHEDVAPIGAEPMVEFLPRRHAENG